MCVHYMAQKNVFVWILHNDMQELERETEQEMLESINSLGPLNYQISEIPQSNGNLKSTIFGMHVCMCECA